MSPIFIKYLLSLSTGLIVIVFYQNCAKTSTGESSSASLRVNCEPQSKPCLKFKLRLGNLNATYGKMGVLFQGTINEGVRPEATFSSACQKINPTYAACTFNTNISARIVSDSTNTTVIGDGRSLTVQLFTDRTIQSEQYGNLAKINTETDLCFESDVPLYNGDVIPLSELTSYCEEPSIYGDDL